MTMLLRAATAVLTSALVFGIAASVRGGVEEPLARLTIYLVAGVLLYFVPQMAADLVAPLQSQKRQ
jgi:hypothetical protein